MGLFNRDVLLLTSGTLSDLSVDFLAPQKRVLVRNTVYLPTRVQVDMQTNAPSSKPGSTFISPELPMILDSILSPLYLSLLLLSLLLLPLLLLSPLYLSPLLLQ